VLHWWFSALALVGGGCVAAYAVYVWQRRQASAGNSLALVLAAASWWGLAYALELANTRLSVKLFWGDTKYLGTCLLPPAWFTFIMKYTGRDRWVNWRTLTVVAAPLASLIVLLAVPATHDLIRYYPPSAQRDPADAIAQVGPLFWPFLGYGDLIILGSTALFVWTLTRISRLYWRQSLVLAVVVLLPVAANALHNLDVGPFGRVELTPFLFVLSGGVLVWGIFRFRLLDLAPIARSSVFETMRDAVLVLDPYRRVVNLNPAAESVFNQRAARIVGRPVETLLPVKLAALDPDRPLELPVRDRYHELTVTPLRDRRGRQTGQVMVLRDVTERFRVQERLAHLDEQRRLLLSHLVNAQEEERRQLAAGLHDDAIQALTSASLRLERFRERLGDPWLRDQLKDVEQAMAACLRRLRTLVFELRPLVLDEAGLAAALREYLAVLAGEAGFEVELRDDLAAEPAAETRVIAYRIAQEALSNVRRHARATKLHVHLEDADGGLRVTVTDDGVGFAPDHARANPLPGHLGLASMRERAELAGGWHRITSAPGAGTTVVFWLPTSG
jgi:signal transduction histidine kinase